MRLVELRGHGFDIAHLSKMSINSKCDLKSL